MARFRLSLFKKATPKQTQQARMEVQRQVESRTVSGAEHVARVSSFKPWKPIYRRAAAGLIGLGLLGLGFKAYVAHLDRVGEPLEREAQIRRLHEERERLIKLRPHITEEEVKMRLYGPAPAWVPGPNSSLQTQAPQRPVDLRNEAKRVRPRKSGNH